MSTSRGGGLGLGSARMTRGKGGLGFEAGLKRVPGKMRKYCIFFMFY
jgi:hypothetical protein